MVEGFETHTDILREKEIMLAKLLVLDLQTRIGHECAITSSEIIDGFKGQGIELTGARLRAIIHYIRINKLILNLVASNIGYYVERDQKKIMKYMLSLSQRSASILEVRDSFSIPVL